MKDARLQDHIAFLDNLRGLAIFLVFLRHSGMRAFGGEGFALRSPVDLHSVFFDVATAVPSIGGVGVSIFFVVSGFCIHLSHVRSREKGFTAFFGRRFFRLYPAYLVALLLSAFVIPPFLPLLSIPEPVTDLASHLLLIHNLFPSFSYSINGPLWSIGVEVQLYLLYPLLLEIVGRLGWKNGLILILAVEFFFVNLPSIFYRLHPLNLTNNNILSTMPFCFWFSWSIGAKLADDWIKDRPVFMSSFPIWIWPVCFLAACTNSALGRYGFTFAALFTAGIIAFFLSNASFVASLPKFPIVDHFRKVGLISYSAYLIHEPCLGQFLGAFRRLFPVFSNSHFVTFLFCLGTWPLICGVAWMMYRFIELPGIAFGRRILGSSKSLTTDRD